MGKPERGVTFEPRLATWVAVAALLACGGSASSVSSPSSSADVVGNYVGTLTTSGACGSGELTVSVFQGGMNLFGTWTTTGFGASPGCAPSSSGGTASGAIVERVVYLTLTKGSQAFRLAGTYSDGTISGTFTQDFSTGSGVSPGGAFSMTKQ